LPVKKQDVKYAWLKVSQGGFDVIFDVVEKIGFHFLFLSCLLVSFSIRAQTQKALSYT